DLLLGRSRYLCLSPVALESLANRGQLRAQPAVEVLGGDVWSTHRGQLNAAREETGRQTGIYLHLSRLAVLGTGHRAYATPTFHRFFSILASGRRSGRIFSSRSSACFNNRSRTVLSPAAARTMARASRSVEAPSAALSCSTRERWAGSTARSAANFWAENPACLRRNRSSAPSSGAGFLT